MNTETKLPTTLDALSRLKTGEAKRDQVVKIAPHMLRLKADFNVRYAGFTEAEYWAQPHIEEYVESLAQSYLKGDHVPNMVGSFSAKDQLVDITDGAHRYKGLMRALERGAKILYVKIDQCSADDAIQNKLMFKTGNSLKLSAVSKAEIVKRFETWGFEPKQIAEELSIPLHQVYQLLKIYNLPLEKKRLIQLGKLTINRALTPAEEIEKNAKRKANRVATNKVMDALIATEKVEIEGNMAKICIPLDLWEAFLLAQADKKEEQVLDMAVKEFKEKQENLPFESVA